MPSAGGVGVKTGEVERGERRRAKVGRTDVGPVSVLLKIASEKASKPLGNSDDSPGRDTCGTKPK